MPKSYRSWVTQDVFCDFMASRSKETLYFHDYEAGGTEAKWVPPLEFAGIRTDLNLNIIDEPMDIYCRLHGDKIPHPVAIQITKISPLMCYLSGIPEPIFFREILREMMLPETCSLGYNSIGYDDEVTRFGLWRNLLPVYPREYANGNSRWDLVDVTAAFKALNVKGIKWPVIEDKVSLRLEHLCSENDVTQDNAHNALDDVKALIGWAKILKAADQTLWEYLYLNRKKVSVKGKFRRGNFQYACKITYGADMDYHSPVLILGQVGGEANKFATLRVKDIQKVRDCWSLSSEELSKRLFSTKEELEQQGVDRPPLDTVMINKCPIMIPPEMMVEYGVMSQDDVEQVKAKALAIYGQTEFVNKLIGVFEQSDEFPKVPAEESLYAEGFPSRKDEQNIATLMGSSVSQAFEQPMLWDNAVYSDLYTLCRYKLNGDGVALTNAEEKDWKEMRKRLLSRDRGLGKHDSG